MKLIHIYDEYINQPCGSLFNIVVKRTSWKSKTQEFIVVGQAPITGFYGYDNFGEAKAYDGNEEDWEFIRAVGLK